MRKIIILALGCVLTTVFAATSEPAPADQKWLGAVQQMISRGETTVSTPQKERSELLQSWAQKNGYSVQVSQTERGYTVTVAKKNLASK